MKISDIAIERPVLASMMSAALVLFGVLGYTRLSVREFPDVDPPIISVNTVLPGANPQVVESAVTDILEEELSTVEGLRTLTSASAEQFSNITLEFNLERDVEVGGAGRPRQGLPGAGPAAGARFSSRSSPNRKPTPSPSSGWRSRGPTTTCSSSRISATASVKSRLQTLPGVGQARIFGERRFSMRVWLSASELAARGLTVQDVENAIRTRSVEIPSGRIESERREFSGPFSGRAQDPGRVRRPGGG